MSFATGIREATDEEVDALVGPGFCEWWRANSPKPKTIQSHTEYLAAKDLELAASLQKQGLLPSTILTATQSIPVPRPAASTFQVGDKVKIMHHTGHVLATGEVIQEGPVPNPPNIQQYLVRTDSGASNWCFANTLVRLVSSTSRVLPTIGMAVKRKASGRKGIVTKVDHVAEDLAVAWNDGGGGIGAWDEFEYPFMHVAGIPIFRSDSAPGKTTVTTGTAGQVTMQGIVDAVMAVDNVVWCGVVENAAGYIHILVREDDVNNASRSEIIDAILQTKPVGVRAVGPISMNGAAFQFVTAAELLSGVKLYGEISNIEIQGTIYHDERKATVVTSRVRVCAKCGNQSKHAESETSMGLCFDCFEARR